MYIKAAGFTYGDDLIENFYLSLKSKPFVILAGTSGTGKTRLVRLFAEAIGATSKNHRYYQVAVRKRSANHGRYQNAFNDFSLRQEYDFEELEADLLRISDGTNTN